MPPFFNLERQLYRNFNILYLEGVHRAVPTYAFVKVPVIVQNGLITVQELLFYHLNTALDPIHDKITHELLLNFSIVGIEGVL